MRFPWHYITSVRSRIGTLYSVNSDESRHGHASSLAMLSKSSSKAISPWISNAAVSLTQSNDNIFIGLIFYNLAAPLLWPSATPLQCVTNPRTALAVARRVSRHACRAHPSREMFAQHQAINYESDGENSSSLGRLRS